MEQGEDYTYPDIEVPDSLLFDEFGQKKAA